MLKYRKTILAAIGLAFTVAAAVFPDVMLPNQELVEEVLTAIENIVTQLLPEGAPE